MLTWEKIWSFEWVSKFGQNGTQAKKIMCRGKQEKNIEKDDRHSFSQQSQKKLVSKRRWKDPLLGVLGHREGVQRRQFRMEWGVLCDGRCWDRTSTLALDEDQGNDADRGNKVLFSVGLGWGLDGGAMVSRKTITSCEIGPKISELEIDKKYHTFIIVFFLFRKVAEKLKHIDSENVRARITFVSEMRDWLDVFVKFAVTWNRNSITLLLNALRSKKNCIWKYFILTWFQETTSDKFMEKETTSINERKKIH